MVRVLFRLLSRLIREYGSFFGSTILPQRHRYSLVSIQGMSPVLFRFVFLFFFNANEEIIY